MNARSPARQAGLLVVVFIATFVLLAGGWALLARAPDRGSGASPTASSDRGGGGPSATTRPAPPSSSGPGATKASGPGDGTVLLGAGDIADCDLDGAARTSQLLLREPGRIFTLGDNIYPNGTSAEFDGCFGRTWGRLMDRTLLPVAGNHDWNTDGAAAYRAWFGSAGSGVDGTTWYSREVAAWHVIVLDSDCAKVGGCGPESAQGRWLAADLAASDARCTLALYHHPRFSSGEHGNDAVVQPLWAALHAGGVELVLNGHDHDYERFAPMDASGTEQRPGGMRELVVGTGGARLREFHEVAANSELRLAGVWGVLRLTLDPTSYSWEFLPVDGLLADAGRTPCHGAP